MTRLSKVVRHLRREGFVATCGRIHEVSAETLARHRRDLRTWIQRTSGQTYVRSEYGIRMRANWDDLTFRFCLTGAYGPFYADYLRSIDTSFFFVDIGANQGLYTLLATRNPCCGGAVAFEPVAATYALLVDNIRANRRMDCVRAVHAGVSSAPGHLEIHRKGGHSGAASLEHAFPGDEAETIELVDVRRVDELLPATSDIVVKIDVEGHEDVVIQEVLKSRHVDRVTSVFYEVHEEWLAPATIERRLRRAGFTQFEVIGEGSWYDVLATR